MLHYMKLKPEPFEKIASGKKTIELRLYDEKRQLLSVGDEIEFSNTSNENRKLVVKILALHRFNSFCELYKSLPLEKCGYSKEEVLSANPRDMDIYYSPDEQKKYGVVGIELQTIR